MAANDRTSRQAFFTKFILKCAKWNDLLRDGIRLAHHHIAHVSVQSHRNRMLWDHGSDERRTPHTRSVKMQAMAMGRGTRF